MAFSQNIRGYARLIDSSLSFQLTEPTHVYTHTRGKMRLFSKLSISGTFWGETAETQLVRDMGLAHPDVIKGKFYLGKASDIVRLVSWFNEKLKQRGCGDYVKKLERTDGRPVLRAVFFRLGGLLLYELVL